ncbi:MIP/aquaporin family protein [Streptomyces sp. JJ38]|uniref:aquaporin n=1 Tax=Streptomyces sp. JJ38 TaxID=2738128 RepID=UPI001C5A51DE|nr:MIP/aquaporin family protein [Streptomyces sp. JJ38]MBW1596898.1 aquaporin family protein [Streptomyces sp. JJ38]
MTRPASLRRRAAAEALGTALLAAVIIGSGIQADRLSPDIGVKLLANVLASVTALGLLIALLAPVSGAHLNPFITLAAWWSGELRPRHVAAYLAAQFTGALAGAVLAHAMYGQPLLAPAGSVRWGPGVWLAEAVATAGLLLVAFGLTRSGRAPLVPLAVSAWIAAAIWFTPSNSFANPALTVARSLSDTFAGIAPSSAALYLAAQLVGAVAGLAAVVVLFGRASPRRPSRVVTRSPAPPAPAPPSASPADGPGPPAARPAT